MAQLPGPAAAAANVAAVEEEPAAWLYELDLDDSDIPYDPPFLSHFSVTAASRPQQDKPPHLSHHHRRVPGPAATVQETTRLRCDTRPPHSLGRWDAHATDADFLLPPWLRALQYLGKDRAWEQPGIRAIKDNEELRRARLVAGVVTSCKPNGLGDLFLMVKDPTDSIGASVHKKGLLQDNDVNDISIGCAVVFNEVAIFRPSRKSCYLNVNKGKVMKVFSKDCDAPSKQVISSSTTERSQGEDSTSNIMTRILGHEDVMPRNKERTVIEVSGEHYRTPDSINSTSTSDVYSTDTLVGDPHSKYTSSCSSDTHLQKNLSIPNTIGCVSTPKENANAVSGSLLNPKGVVSFNSLAEWTDEELLELCVDQ